MARTVLAIYAVMKKKLCYYYLMMRSIENIGNRQVEPVNKSEKSVPTRKQKGYKEENSDREGDKSATQLVQEKLTKDKEKETTTSEKAKRLKEKSKIPDPYSRGLRFETKA